MDANVVSSVLEDAKREYAKKAGVPLPTIVVDKVYLPPPPTDHIHSNIAPSWLVHSFSTAIYMFLNSALLINLMMKSKSKLWRGSFGFSRWENCM